MSASESEDAELERGKALMAADSLVTRFCLYGFLKSAPFPRGAHTLHTPCPSRCHKLSLLQHAAV